MKNIILIFILFPLLIYGQWFNQPKQGKDTTHTFILRSIADTFTTKSDTVINRIDSTNKILSKFYFESCGASIPSNFLGYKFDNSIDLACTGNSPSSTEVCDFQHCTQSTPLTCIAMSNQSAMQSYINSTLIPDLNTCYGTSLVANDIIYLYNSTLDEVEVWYNPALITANPTPHNFVIAPLGTGSGCDKPFPSIPITSS